MQRTAPEVVSASILGALTGWTLCCGDGRQETPLQQPGSIISGLEECSTGGGSGTASVFQSGTRASSNSSSYLTFSTGQFLFIQRNLTLKYPKINV